MFRKTILTIFLTLITLTSLYGQQGLEDLQLKDLFHEPYLPGVRPVFSNFSADMNKIYFSWNDSAYTEMSTYEVDLGGRNLERADRDVVLNYSLNYDNSLIVYTKNNNLIVSDPDLEDKRVLVETKSGISNPVWSPDGTMIAFLQGDEIWITSIEKPYLSQVTNNKIHSPSFYLDSWIGNGRLLLQSTDHTRSRTIYFPDYLGDFVTPGSTTRGIPKTTFAVADLESGTIDTLISDRNRSATSASPSGRYLAIDYADPALKHRKIKVFDFEEDAMNIVFEDSTDGWLHETNADFNPVQDILMIQSEKDGWNHIYTIHADGTNFQQHTAGEFEVPWAEWLDPFTILYASTEEDPGVRHLYTYNIRNNDRKQLTERSVYRYEFNLSPDKRYIVYAKTYFNEPYDLFRLNLERPELEVQLTNSVPERFNNIDWQIEDYIRFPGRDGETKLSMSVLYPPGFDSNREHPVIVFFHGAGSLQNVYKGWSNNYWREYMFHQFLTLQGYIVVEVDFRHSTGYGRDFREDVTNWMGKYETEDTVDGLDWLQENVGGLDLSRVGSYGGSYGGFMALYATSAEPERFHAAAALRAVTNWRNYYYANPWYTKPRLGTPEEDPDHYDRSSPLTFASEMKHPVLILHGLIDDNVGFQDAVQYIEKLIQAGNEDFEMMMYPSERHSFTEPAAWYDEYRRIFEFFEKYLKD
jgi:dipeptidyl aminopeptidase/acylaminoacyl peptidase